MVDYYAILWRAVTAPDAGDAQWRRGIYDRARQMLPQQLRAQRPPVPPAAIMAEQSALEAAIARIESELSGTDRGAPDRDGRAEEQTDGRSGALRLGPRRGPVAIPFRLSGATSVVLAIAVAALAAGVYAFWPKTAPKSAPPAIKSEAQPASEAPRATRDIKPALAKDADLAPGVDGGSSDPELAYTFRRQPVFYRTPQPVGSIIIDKLQHLLYLIQPNNVALRYGIGLGEQCADLAGLRHISSKAEWPQWQPPPDIVKRKLAKPDVLPGGPGNPLGARVLQLDDGSSSIHGTNAPKTIGTTVILGCIRLANDDIVDLYNRVQVRTPVLVD